MKATDRTLYINKEITYKEVYERVIDNKEFYRTPFETLKFIGDVDINVRALLIKHIRCKTIEIEKANLEPITFANNQYLNHYWVFKNCNLEGLKIDNISHAHALKLYKCNVDKLTITKSKLVECNFSQLTYKDITLQDSRFKKCYFKEVNLSRLDFVRNNIQFDNCSFISADLRHTKWNKYNDTCLVNHKFNKANLTNANFNSINLSGSSFKLAKLENTNFSGCNLHESNFEETTLIDCDLSHTNCYKTCFNNSTLKTCNLSRASIDWAGFRNTKLIDTYLTTAYYTIGEHSINHFGCSAIDLLKLYPPDD